MIAISAALASRRSTTIAFVAFDSAFSRLGWRIVTLDDASIVRKRTRLGPALRRLSVGRLDVEARQPAVEHAREPPVGLAGQQHEAGDENAAHDDGVEQHGGRERDAEQLDHPEAAEHEGSE